MNIIRRTSEKHYLLLTIFTWPSKFDSFVAGMMLSGTELDANFDVQLWFNSAITKHNIKLFPIEQIMTIHTHFSTYHIKCRYEQLKQFWRMSKFSILSCISLASDGTEKCNATNKNVHFSGHMCCVRNITMSIFTL